MKTLLGFLVLLSVAVLVGSLRIEVTTRLESVPCWLLRWAARRLPADMRADQLEEWTRNVEDVIYPETDGLPITRLGRAFTYSVSALWGARRLARAGRADLPPNVVLAMLAWCYLMAARIDERLARRRVPYVLRCAVHYVISRAAVIGFVGMVQIGTFGLAGQWLFMVLYFGATVVGFLAAGALYGVQQRIESNPSVSPRATYIWVAVLETNQITCMAAMPLWLMHPQTWMTPVATVGLSLLQVPLFTWLWKVRTAHTSLSD